MVVFCELRLVSAPDKCIFKRVFGTARLFVFLRAVLAAKNKNSQEAQPPASTAR